MKKYDATMARDADDFIGENVEFWKRGEWEEGELMAVDSQNSSMPFQIRTKEPRFFLASVIREIEEKQNG